MPEMEAVLRLRDEFSVPMDRARGRVERFDLAMKNSVAGIRQFEHGLQVAIGAIAAPIGLIATVTALAATIDHMVSRFIAARQEAMAFAEAMKATQDVSGATAKQLGLARAGQDPTRADPAIVAQERLRLLMDQATKQFAHLAQLQEQLAFAGVKTALAFDIAGKIAVVRNEIDATTAAIREQTAALSTLSAVKPAAAIMTGSRLIAPQDRFVNPFESFDPNAQAAAAAWAGVALTAKEAAQQMTTAELARLDKVVTAQLDAAALQVETTRQAAVETANSLRDALNVALSSGRASTHGLTGAALEAQTALANEALVNTLNVPGALEALTGRTQAQANLTAKAQTATINATMLMLPNVRLETKIDAKVDINGQVLTAIAQAVAVILAGVMGNQSTQAAGT